MKKMTILVAVVMILAVFAAECGDKEFKGPQGTYMYTYNFNEIYYYTFNNNEVIIEYPDGTVETSDVTIYHKKKTVSFDFLGSYGEWKYDGKSNQLTDGSGDSKMTKTTDRNPELNSDVE